MSADPLAPLPDPRGALLALLAAPGRRAGRFRRVMLPDGAACVPLSLDGRHLGAVSAVSAVLPAPADAPAGAAFRLATALRQDLWRRLRHVRGFVPVTAVRILSCGWEATAWGCQLDRTVASPGTLDVLGEIFQDAAVRQSLRWACRAVPRPPRPNSSEGA